MNQKILEKVLEKGIFRSKAEAERNINSIFDSILEILIEEKQLAFYKRFSLKIYKRKEKVGINPKTKEKVKIPARNIIKLKVSKNILEKI